MFGFLGALWRSIQNRYRCWRDSVVIAKAHLCAEIVTRYNGGYRYQHLEPGHIRVLTVFPPQTSRSDEPIECVLEHVAFEDLTPEYQDWEEKTGHNLMLQPCKARSAWIEHMGCRQAHAHDKAYPLYQNFSYQAHTAARFVWGDYVALSYCWGSDEEHVARHIILNGCRVRVTENLEAALHALRSSAGLTSIKPWRPKVWVDALCLNQGDDLEKEHELQRMKEIYGRSFNVFVHLGAEDEDSDRGVEVLQTIAHEVSQGIDRSWQILMGRFQPTETDRKDYTALFKVMTRPYWNRLWVLQELAMGDANMVMGCGTRVFPLEDINLAAKFLWYNVESFILTIRSHALNSMDELPADVDAELTKDLSEKIEALNRSMWVMEFFPQLRALSHRLEQSRAIPYIDLQLFVFNLSQNAQSSLQHDKIYGILGIMPQPVRSAMKKYIDYSLPIDTVFAAFSQIIMEYTGRLDIIYLKSFQQTMRPSWVTDWRLPPHRISLLHDYSPAGYHQFKNAYENLNQMVEIGRTSQADGGRCISPNILAASSTLCCSGILLGKIDGLAAPMQDLGAADCPSFEHIQPKNNEIPYGDEIATTSALVHTLFSNPVWGDSEEASLFNIPWLCDESYPDDINRLIDGDWQQNMKRMIEHNWNFIMIQGNYSNFESFRCILGRFRIGGKLFKDYFTRNISDCTIPQDRVRLDMAKVIGCSIGRRLITLESGHFGLAPNCAQPGDQVYVIMGCSMPVVLRPVLGTSYFTVIGECYVEGFARGEAVTGLDVGRYELQSLSLR